MKKKFTFKLILIIFAAVLALWLVINGVILIVNNHKQKAFDAQMVEYLENVKLYKENNENSINKNAVIIKVTLGDLIDGNYTKDNIQNPLTGEIFSRDMTFCIINDNGEYTYKYDNGVDCGNTIITYTNTPEEMYNGYLYTQVVHIDFSPLEGLEYYIKSSVPSTADINVNFRCGSGNKPGNCFGISSTKQIEANMWYRVSGDINLTYDEQNDESGIIYTLTTDEEEFNYLLNSSISLIDRTSPVVVLDTPVSSTNSVSVKIKSMTDIETDIASSVCKYGTVIDNYTTTSMSNARGKLSKCSINYILKDKIYYYEVCATDEVGNIGCASGSSLIPSIKNPTIVYSENIVSVAFGKKKKTLTYYIMSTVPASISNTTIAYCGKGLSPSDCINSKITELTANAWYQVNGDVDVIYDELSNSEGTLYALIYSDGEYASGVSAQVK